MKYSGLIKEDIANGPGVRVSLFVSGCPHHCKGCFSSETWSYDYGEEFSDKTIDLILEYLKPDYIKGISILGGDPLADKNIETVLGLVKTIKSEYPQKDVWVWTGYTYEELIERNIFHQLVNADVLVDGRFIESKKDFSLKYAGSSNQRVIDIVKTTVRGEIVLYE